jgi:hypothetical protein
MNAPLRKRHRALVVAWAVALPAAFAAAIVGRQEAPTAGELPTDPRALGAVEALGAGAGSLQIVEHADGARFSVRHDGERVAIAQTLGPPLPDLLAYWSPTPALDELPAEVVLLGAVSTLECTFELPRERGWVVLFSLAHGEIVAQAELEAR